ncbi:threonine/serine exporter family protein [Viscerimonas tarda]
MENLPTQISARRFANLILDIGTFLTASGAHCGRINSNIKRIAGKWNFEVDMQPTFRGLLVSVKNLNDAGDNVTLYRESPPHNVRLAVITDVSQLSWQVLEDDLTIDETEEKFSAIRHKSGYNTWIISLAVAVSCAGLCLFSLGDICNAGVAFIAAFTGSIVRYKIARMNFNPMISIAIAASITTMIAGLGSLLNIGENPQAAMATAVLYLIPGVPLINCVIDLIEGYLSSAMNRALFAGFILLCIAAGMTLSITLMGINNFN